MHQVANSFLGLLPLLFNSVGTCIQYSFGTKYTYLVAYHTYIIIINRVFKKGICDVYSFVDINNTYMWQYDTFSLSIVTIITIRFKWHKHISVVPKIYSKNNNSVGWYLHRALLVAVRLVHTADTQDCHFRKWWKYFAVFLSR